MYLENQTVKRPAKTSYRATPSEADDDASVAREDSTPYFVSRPFAQAVKSSQTDPSAAAFGPSVFSRNASEIWSGDVMQFYQRWDPPTIIISDGAYGLGSFPGDPPTVSGLIDWYAPHIREWSRLALPETTLWFWNSEQGWATVHCHLVESGWEFRNCHIWDKGIAHIAGNANSKTLRKFPVTTEVCVQYVKRTMFDADGVSMTMQEWLRYEWVRAGLPLWKTNEACGVKNAATRKYFTADHLWYYPPPEAFEACARYANEHGRPAGRPYFSIDGKRPFTAEEWARMRAKFKCDTGITNVWSEPSVRGIERLKDKHQCVHMNQKPLRLLEIIIDASSEVGDVVWEPFGGLCSASIASHKLGRRSFAAEQVADFFNIAAKRLESYDIF